MTPAIQPSSNTLILRFKHNRSTIILHVDSLQKMSSVRSELLKAIQHTSPTGKFNGHDIPESASDILLARPVDIHNLAAGWEPIDPKTTDGDMASEDKKGKGKATVASGRGRASKEDITDCPQGYGIRDGGIVAFKFRSEAEAEAPRRDADEGIDIADDDKLDGETLVDEPAVEKWDVVIPSIEDTYGDELQSAAAEEVPLRIK